MNKKEPFIWVKNYPHEQAVRKLFLSEISQIFVINSWLIPTYGITLRNPPPDSTLQRFHFYANPGKVRKFIKEVKALGLIDSIKLTPESLKQ